MTEIPAITTTGVERMSVADDGKNALVSFKTTGDDDITIAVPTDTLETLMLFCSQASGRGQSILQRDPTMKHIFPCEWWEVLPHPDGKHVVMSYRMPGGLEVSFQIHRDAAQGFRETLDAVLGNAAIPSNGTPRH